MKTIALKGYQRTEFGKGATGRLRRTGFVPCELYGPEGNRHFQAFYADFKDIIYTPETYKVELQLAEGQYHAVIQDIQFNPMSDDLNHVDFLQVTEDKPVKVELPIKFTGNSQGVREGGKLVRKMRTLTVRGPLSDIPESIEVDITELGLGKNVRVGDVKPQRNVEILNQPSNPMATIAVPRGLKGKTEEADAKAKKK